MLLCIQPRGNKPDRNQIKKMNYTDYQINKHGLSLLVICDAGMISREATKKVIEKIGLSKNPEKIKTAIQELVSEGSVKIVKIGNHHCLEAVMPPRVLNTPIFAAEDMEAAAEIQTKLAETIDGKKAGPMGNNLVIRGQARKRLKSKLNKMVVGYKKGEIK